VRRTEVSIGDVRAIELDRKVKTVISVLCLRGKVVSACLSYSDLIGCNIIGGESTAVSDYAFRDDRISGISGIACLDIRAPHALSRQK
jgi:hypothetical protein